MCLHPQTGYITIYPWLYEQLCHSSSRLLFGGCRYNNSVHECRPPFQQRLLEIQIGVTFFHPWLGSDGAMGFVSNCWWCVSSVVSSKTLLGAWDFTFPALLYRWVCLVHSGTVDPNSRRQTHDICNHWCERFTFFINTETGKMKY